MFGLGTTKSKNFKSQYSLEERIRIRKKKQQNFQNYVGFIIEKANTSENINELDKKDYFVSSQLTMLQLIQAIGKKAKKKEQDSLYFYIGEKKDFLNSSDFKKLVGEIYEKY